MNKISIFISYSYDSESHCDWVRKFADSLEEQEKLHIVWDGYDLDATIDKNEYMQSGVFDSDYIIVVATRKYKEKADSRSGGVGIETYMATAAHWEMLQNTKKTKIIVILREKESIPNYLKGHLHVDFTNDDMYEKSINKLLKPLLNKDKIQRPKKKHSKSNNDYIYSFTKIEDLIKIGHTNRHPIVSKDQGTDYSGSNKIKYELWETRSPTIAYYLVLANNITINQTVNHAIDKIQKSKIRPINLTILRPRDGDKELIPGLFRKSKIYVNTIELSYKNYIWNYCMDERLKCVDPPSVIPNYTDQCLAFTNDHSEKEIDLSAKDKLVSVLQESSKSSAHLVVASGGMGKTALCFSVADKLHNRQDLNSSVVLIQAESIKNHIAEHGLVVNKIETVFQLYEIYALCQRFDHVFEKNTFELAFLAGNIVVIIDGLDEFVSMFPELFDLDAFLYSLVELHNELGNSAVLLTTRNNRLIESTKLDELNIKKYELLGFDNKACEWYLGRRFRKYTTSKDLIKRVLSKIDKVKLKDKDDRIVPFFVDIAATVVEDGLENNKTEDLEIIEDPTPYPSTNDLTDHVLYSVMRREKVRQELDLSVEEVVQLLSGLVADYSRRWPASEMLERLTLLYDSRGKTLCSKISLNPLLVQIGDYIGFRYSFLSSYFLVVYLLEGILYCSIEPEFIRALAFLSTDSNEFRELIKFFNTHNKELKKCSKELISRLLEKLYEERRKDDNNERKRNIISIQRAISTILNITAKFMGGSTTHTQEMICYLYNKEKTDNAQLQISDLYIRGEFPPMDFSELTITNSRFHRYKNLLSSKFSQTKFMYCIFHDCYDRSVKKPTLRADNIDHTCKIGNLREYIEIIENGEREEMRILEDQLRKFLNSFYRSGCFIDNNRIHIKYSKKINSLSEKKFDKIVSEGYISLNIIKEIDNFYTISEWFRPSVRKFLSDNYKDSMMKKFIKYLQK